MYSSAGGVGVRRKNGEKPPNQARTYQQHQHKKVQGGLPGETSPHLQSHLYWQPSGGPSLLFLDLVVTTHEAIVMTTSIYLICRGHLIQVICVWTR